MKLPPGIRYLLASPGLFLPPFTLWSTRYALTTFVKDDLGWIPSWLWALTLLTSPFTFFAIKLHVYKWRNRIKARQLGAIEPPLVPAKWPGSVDTVYQMFQRDNVSYLGEFCELLGIQKYRPPF